MRKDGIEEEEMRKNRRGMIELKNKKRKSIV
jgi:hypothetical protein